MCREGISSNSLIETTQIKNYLKRQKQYQLRSFMQYFCDL